MGESKTKELIKGSSQEESVGCEVTITEYKDCQHHMRELVRGGLANHEYPHLKWDHHFSHQSTGLILNPRIIIRPPVQYGNGHTFMVGSREAVYFIHGDFVTHDYHDGIARSVSTADFVRAIVGDDITTFGQLTHVNPLEFLAQEMSRVSPAEELKQGHYRGFVDQALRGIEQLARKLEEKYFGRIVAA